MVTVPTGANGKSLAFQAFGVGLHRLFAHVFKIDKGKHPDLLDGRDAGDTHQLINHRAGKAAAIGHIHVHPVPAAIHTDLRIQPGQ